ncbi:MAG: alanine racemase [Bacillota bacterium]|nr:alanine racemase [Bacillota bacterium]
MNRNDILRDTYLEVNLDALEHNINEIKKTIGKEVEISAVIKSDGYGYGATGIAKTLHNLRIKYLSVANLLEAVELKNINPEYRVMIMGHTPDYYLETAVKYNVTLTVFSYNQAKLLSEIGEKFNKTITIHIKYDTGFNRLGFKYGKESIQEISKIFKLNNLYIEGVFSHLALNSYEDDLEQLKRFKYLINYFKKINLYLKYYHICDSISGIDYPNFRLDMIRPGAAIYGLKSFKNKNITLKNIGTFKTKISNIKTLSEGEGVSYDYTWIAKKETKTATVPFGYGDGYPRSMFGKGEVTVDGIRCPIIGVLCMDQCIIDVSSIRNPYVGQEVIIWSDGSNNTVSIQELSDKSGTNKNEIVSRITRRVPRVYMKNGEISSVLNYLL